MPELFMNLQAGVLSAAPGAAGTTLNSGNFANLPAVAAPNYMRLVLDPDGASGVPEIVIVTAHTAFATSCTVLRGQETAYGAGPGRAHAIDTIWHHSLTRQSLLELTVPAGSIVATVAATPDTGYLFIDGSTVTNGQVLYPNTWLRIPGSWQSAPNIVFPDWRGRTLFSDDTGAVFTLGATAGANSHAITQAELPAVALSIDPPNTVVSIDPSSATVAITDPGHPHSTWPPAGTGGSNPGVVMANTALGFTGPIPANTTGITASVDIAAFDVNVDIAPFNSPNLGSGTAMSLVPACGVIQWQIKCH